MKLKDITSPFYVWQRAFEKPYTQAKPIQERIGAHAHRGFHINDIEKCVDCGTCEEICQNGAIDMVTIDMVKIAQKASEKGDNGLVRALTTGVVAGVHCVLISVPPAPSV